MRCVIQRIYKMLQMIQSMQEQGLFCIWEVGQDDAFFLFSSMLELLWINFLLYSSLRFGIDRAAKTSSVIAGVSYSLQACNHYHKPPILSLEKGAGLQQFNSSLLYWSRVLRSYSESSPCFQLLFHFVPVFPVWKIRIILYEEIYEEIKDFVGWDVLLGFFVHLTCLQN